MNLVDDLLSLVFPNRCIYCNSKSYFLICDSCLSRLDIEFDRCERCSTPINSKGFCSVCLKEDREFVKGFSLFNYKDGFVSNMIELFKFYGVFGMADVLDFFAETLKKIDFFEFTDCFVPVPMHIKALRKRGYNQALLIAKKLSKITKIPVCFDCVVKVKQTKSQVGLTYGERKKNLKGAFKVFKLKSGIKRVVIVDDVFTTGSTINEIASLLKKHSIESYFFTLASTPQIE